MGCACDIELTAVLFQMSNVSVSTCRCILFALAAICAVGLLLSVLQWTSDFDFGDTRECKCEEDNSGGGSNYHGGARRGSNYQHNPYRRLLGAGYSRDPDTPCNDGSLPDCNTITGTIWAIIIVSLVAWCFLCAACCLCFPKDTCKSFDEATIKGCCYKWCCCCESCQEAVNGIGSRGCSGIGSILGECSVFCCGMAGAVCAAFKMQKSTSSEFYADEFAAAQRKHEEKCAALQKQVDDEKKSQSTDGLIVTIADSSGKQISLTAMGSHSVSMVCKQLSVSAFSFAQTEFPQGSSKTLGTMGVCNGATLNVTSLPADMPSQVTMQSQLQLELDRMREWDAPQREGYKYTKVSKSCCCLPCGSTETALDVNKRTKVQPTAPQPAQFRVEAHSQL